MSRVGAARLAVAGGIGYALGAMPSARIAAHLVSRGAVDVTADGTGNPGALNTMRLLGRLPGFAVAAADVGKGLGAALLGRRIAGDTGAHLGAVAAVAGHCYPPAAGKRGGKGVATSFGQCLGTFPAFAPLDVAVALVATRLRARRPALVSVATSATCWIGAGAVWWRRGLPNLWGPSPSLALPIANAATSALIASRAVSMIRAREPDELVLGADAP